jgi:EAL domain-containing protein (putative c-di-GMP-specific phosphodiesterase class I)
MDAHVESRIAMETELRAAVAAKTIVPYYQPVVAFEGSTGDRFRSVGALEKR